MMKCLTMLLVPFLTVGTLTAAAHADKPAAKVNGKGKVTMVATGDDDLSGGPTVFEGDRFRNNHFKINGRVNADGSARGTASFVFGEGFSNIWGADVITLKCEIDTGYVREDGTVVLEGISVEKDFYPIDEPFVEITPFEIRVDPDGLFTLRWCELARS